MYLRTPLNASVATAGALAPLTPRLNQYLQITLLNIVTNSCKNKGKVHFNCRFQDLTLTGKKQNSKLKELI